MFTQVGALISVTRSGPAFPMSRVLTFIDTSDELSLDVYLNSTNWKPWPKIGWYPKGAGHTVVELRYAFHHPGTVRSGHMGVDCDQRRRVALVPRPGTFT